MKVGPGGRVLMCPPDYYGIYYEINPWMSVAKQADREKARQQWQELYDLYRALGVKVDLMEPVEGLPDMVFTANAGVVSGDLFIATNFRYPERQGEEKHFCSWFEAHDYRVERLPKGCFFEGMGDVKLYRELLFAGFYFRSDVRTHLMVGEKLEKLVVSLELTDRRFYHLDTCFCPLDDALVMYYPPALQDYSQEAIKHHTETQLEIDEEDALA
ncbi:MAG: arginine deiminase-related protein, partial [Dehalococcoidia bacterium]|nr:arginine deiminase-related protein [Dehalococcoidia bacterium]